MMNTRPDESGGGGKHIKSLLALVGRDLLGIFALPQMLHRLP